MIIREMSKEEIQKIRNLDEALKGTREWGKYMMPVDWKSCEPGGFWESLCWSYPNPNVEYILKQSGGKKYIESKPITTSSGFTFTERFLCTDAVIEALSLEV